ncbi:MAG TPA: hypothetical protein PLZ86_02880 [bacterium]|nr:hypothetical protein [bacterium]
MAGTIDELTINWTDESDGVQKVKELKKEVLTRGSWATLMYLYQELDPKKKDWGPAKIRIQRYQKRGDNFIPRSKFVITSPKQGYQIIDVIKRWFPENPADAKAEGETTEEAD